MCSYCQLLWKSKWGETWGIIFCCTVINSARKQISLSLSHLCQRLLPFPGCSSGKGMLCLLFPLGMWDVSAFPHWGTTIHLGFSSPLWTALAQPSDLIIFPHKPGNILVPEGQFNPTFFLQSLCTLLKLECSNCKWIKILCAAPRGF